MLRQKSLMILLALGILLILSGCVERPQLDKVEQKLQELKERPSGRIDPLPEFPEPHVARYSRSNQRDPFTPDRVQVLTTPATISSLAPDLDRPRQPLEKWQLSDLSLRGVMQQGSKVRALVLTPERELISVEVGDYIGQNHGQVIAINPQQVHLVELVYDNQTGWQERKQELSISR